MHSGSRRWEIFHAVVDNGVDNGVIVSQDAHNNAEPFIETIATMHASSAAGNDDMGEWEGAHGGGSRISMDMRVRKEMVRAIPTGGIGCYDRDHFAHCALAVILSNWGRCGVHIGTCNNTP